MRKQTQDCSEVGSSRRTTSKTSRNVSKKHLVVSKCKVEEDEETTALMYLLRIFTGEDLLSPRADLHFAFADVDQF